MSRYIWHWGLDGRARWSKVDYTESSPGLETEIDFVAIALHHGFVNVDCFGQSNEMSILVLLVQGFGDETG